MYQIKTQENGKYTLTEDEDKFIIVFKESKTKTEHYIDKAPELIIADDEPEDVDTTPPTVSVSKQEITTKSITVKVEATDKESGMASNLIYTYFIN